MAEQKKEKNVLDDYLFPYCNLFVITRSVTKTSTELSRNGILVTSHCTTSTFERMLEKYCFFCVGGGGEGRGKKKSPILTC